MKTDKYIYIKIALDEVKSMETFIYYMKKIDLAIIKRYQRKILTDLFTRWMYSIISKMHFCMQLHIEIHFSINFPHIFAKLESTRETSIK